MRFYLGTHRPAWLGRVGVPLFVSHRTLRDYRTLPQASGPWSLDSGGFTELSTFGEWRTTADEYIVAATRYRDEIGKMDFAAPRDWMCEPWITEKTGLTVEEHQKRTVYDFLDLTSRSDVPFIPVLQGWDEGDYMRCVEMYDAAGVDLRNYAVVGIGSVCRRQGSDEITRILARVAAAGIRLHGFGLKKGGLTSAAPFLASADSMAWSFGARYEPALPGHTHKTCANCMEFALRWRDRIITQIGGDGWTLAPTSSERVTWQPSLLG